MFLRKASASRVLACSINARHEELLRVDESIYAENCLPPTIESYSSPKNFLRALSKQRYEIVHFYGDIVPSLGLVGDDGSVVSGAELLSGVTRSSVKLFWFANDHESSSYIRFFSPLKVTINLVMTMQRRGVAFPSFLRKLLNELSHGEPIGWAWERLAPQAPGSWHEDLPGCIFHAGIPGFRLTPGAPRSG